MQKPLLDKLPGVTRSLLDRSRPAYSLRSEVLELKSILEEAGGEIADKGQDIAAGESHTENGVAISPTMASMCVDDFGRTVQFIRGVDEAISDLRKKIIGRPIRVLYAGCGPWAALAVPSMSLLSSYEVKFTLLDIHVASIASLHSLIDQLGFSDRIESCEIEDAAEYTIESDAQPDIILIEMLRAALEAEPQVAVATNLFRQAPDAVMIPEEVRIDLELINQSREFTMDGTEEDAVIERDRIDVGEVLVLNKAAIQSWITDAAVQPAPVSLKFPEFDALRYRPMLTTTIRVYGAHSLKDYDSGITCPKALPPGTDARPGRTIEFRYEMGKHPGLRPIQTAR